jgi:aldehyde dehydrogenase (NAD+)
MTTSQADYRLFTGGGWKRARGGTFADYNPSTGEVWKEIPDATREDAKEAIDAAAAAFPAWAATPHTQRALILNRAADILERRTPEIADIIVDEGGGWIGKAMFEKGYVVGLLRAAAAAAYQLHGEILPSEYGKVMMVERVPLGVVAVISPWNFPLLLSTRGLCVALAVGNTVVLKPSEETPVAGGLFLAEIFEEAGIPDGVLNVIPCSRDHVAEVGKELITNPKVKGISFTGSSAVGREIAREAAYHLKRFGMELGGKDALIVLDDADMGKAVDAAAFGTFMHQGQICMSVERIIVDESIADEFTDRLVKHVRKLGVGDPRRNPIGPVINQKQLDKIHRQVTEAVEQGADLLTGGTYKGLFYQPTVLTNVDRNMRVFREETFGPVAPIITVEDEEEAIEVANDSDYGLSAGIITRDEERGLRVARQLETGIAHVNDSSVNDEPHVPFGGMKSSGIGRHGGKASIELFTETRWITLERGGRHYPPPFVSEKRPEDLKFEKNGSHKNGKNGKNHKKNKKDKRK